MALIIRRHGMGTEWACEYCDRYHNGYLEIRTFTSSPAPVRCPICFDRVPQHQRQEKLMTVVHAAYFALRRRYGQRFVLPGQQSQLVELILQHKLSDGENPHRVAAIMNQYHRKLEL